MAREAGGGRNGYACHAPGAYEIAVRARAEDLHHADARYDLTDPLGLADMLDRRDAARVAAVAAADQLLAAGEPVRCRLGVLRLAGMLPPHLADGRYRHFLVDRHDVVRVAPDRGGYLKTALRQEDS